VTILDEFSFSVLNEIPVGDQPVALALGPNNTIWVANKKSATISVMDRMTFNISNTINLPAYSQPHGIAFNPAGTKAFVALEGTGDLLALNASTGTEIDRTWLGPNIRHVSVTADGSKVLIAVHYAAIARRVDGITDCRKRRVYFGGDVMASMPER
jgi:DNA-binding beta-propeller fold protein YncE